MPLPPNITKVTLTRSYIRADGTAPPGYVLFELVAPGEVTPDYYVVMDRVIGTLTNGILSIQIASTQDPDLTPSGLVYRITELVPGVNNTPWYAAVPESPAIQTLNSLNPVDPPGLYATRVVSVNNILPDPVTGNVDLGPISAPVTSVNGKTGAVVLIKGDIGLGNVDNTPDVNKPVSTAQATALAGKSNVGHAHVTGDVTGLDTALSGKALKATLDKIVRTSGNIQLNVGTNTWSPLAGSPSVSRPAQVGDLVELNVSVLRQANSNIYLDLGVKVGSSIVRYMATDTATPAGEGNPALYHTALPATGGSWKWVVESGDLDSGVLTCVFAIRNISGASSLLLADTNVPLRMSLCNFGPAGS